MNTMLIREVGATIESLHGQCPVQADGTIGPKKFYFRSRWNQWRIQVGADVHRPEFVYGEPWGNSPGEAGYMPEDVAILMIIKGLEAFKRWEAGDVPESQP